MDFHAPPRPVRVALRDTRDITAVTDRKHRLFLGSLWIGVAMIAFLMLVVFVGAREGANSVKEDCDEYGRFQRGDQVYVCHALGSR